MRFAKSCAEAQKEEDALNDKAMKALKKLMPLIKECKPGVVTVPGNKHWFIIGNPTIIEYSCKSREQGLQLKNEYLSALGMHDETFDSCSIGRFDTHLPAQQFENLLDCHRLYCAERYMGLYDEFVEKMKAAYAEYLYHMDSATPTFARSFIDAFRKIMNSDR